jgi:hypothetical protein
MGRPPTTDAERKQAILRYHRKTGLWPSYSIDREGRRLAFFFHAYRHPQSLKYDPKFRAKVEKLGGPAPRERRAKPPKPPRVLKSEIYKKRFIEDFFVTGMWPKGEDAKRFATLRYKDPTFKAKCAELGYRMHHNQAVENEILAFRVKKGRWPMLGSEDLAEVRLAGSLRWRVYPKSDGYDPAFAAKVARMGGEWRTRVEDAKESV